MYAQNNKQLEQVLEWSEAYKLPVKEDLTIPSQDRIGLAFKLIDEELQETKNIIEKLYIAKKNDENLEIKDLVELIDGFGDTLWVLYRAMMEFGVHNNLDEIFTAIYEANMSKLCDSEEQAQETVDFYMETESLETYYEPVTNGKFAIKRTFDNKVLKNKYWFAPDNKIQEIIERNS